MNSTAKELTPEERERQHLQIVAMELLRDHPSTKMWVQMCNKSHTMDVPMMVVDVIIELIIKPKLPITWAHFAELMDVPELESFLNEAARQAIAQKCFQLMEKEVLRRDLLNKTIVDNISKAKDEVVIRCNNDYYERKKIEGRMLADITDLIDMSTFSQSFHGQESYEKYNSIVNRYKK